MANIYLISRQDEGVRIQEGPNTTIHKDPSVAQFEDPRIKKGYDIAVHAYQALQEGKLHNPEIRNVTNRCVLMGGVFKYEGKDYQLNVFKTKSVGGIPSSSTQIFPLNSDNGEPHMDIQFIDTPVSDLLETGLENYLNNILD